MGTTNSGARHLTKTQQYEFIQKNISIDRYTTFITSMILLMALIATPRQDFYRVGPRGDTRSK